MRHQGRYPVPCRPNHDPQRHARTTADRRLLRPQGVRARQLGRLLMALIDALERLETIWRGLGTPAAQALRPGIPAGEVETELASIGLTPPADLLTWYRWHNG